MAYDEEFFTPEEQAQADRIDDQIDARLHALPFLPPDQGRASDPLLIHELARFYQPEAEEIQSRLQRARERVEHQRAQHLAPQRRKRTPLTRLRSVQERQDHLKKPLKLARLPQHSSRLVTSAAALLLAALVGGLVTGLILVRSHGSTVAHPHPTATLASPTTPTPGSTPASVGALSFMQMFDANTGWALTGLNHILRTTDGANHWQDVTPSDLTPPNQQGNLPYDFLSPSVGWVISLVRSGQNAYQGTVTIFHTTDGGQHWSQTTLHGDIPDQIIFTDSQHGWMLSDQGIVHTADATDIFRTSDGGATWTKVASAGLSTDDRPGALPYSAYKMGIGALNASTAWVTGTANSPANSPWLYVTHDGGATWQRQTLALPANTPSDLPVITGSPIFFNTQDGILPAYFSSTANSPLLYVYVTHDGGATWQSTSLVAADYGNGASIDFITAKEGWVSFRATLYVTSDSGQHWTQIPASTLLRQVLGLSFVSDAVGWVINSTDSGTQLLKTTDGGRTWVVVPLSVA